MKKINEASLLDLLPPNIKEDPDIKAASKAIDTTFFKTVNEVKKCLIVSNIDDIEDEALLELLAWENHVDFWDSSLPIEKKLELIKNSSNWHRRKGTAAAVEELVTAVFGDGKVEEWWEYGGQPYMFRVATSNDSANNEKAEEFIAAVNSVKNQRSHLESVIITKTQDMHIYFGNVVHIGEHITLRQVI